MDVSLTKLVLSKLPWTCGRAGFQVWSMVHGPPPTSDDTHESKPIITILAPGSLKHICDFVVDIERNSGWDVKRVLKLTQPEFKNQVLLLFHEADVKMQSSLTNTFRFTTSTSLVVVSRKTTWKHHPIPGAEPPAWMFPRATCWHPVEDKLAVPRLDLEIWDVAMGKRENVHPLESPNADCLAWHKTHKFPTLKYVTDGKIFNTFPAPPSETLKAFSHRVYLWDNTGTLFAFKNKRTVYISNFNTNTIVHTAHAPDNIRCIHWHPTQPKLAMITTKKPSVFVFDLAAPSPRFCIKVSFREPPACVAWSHGGDLMAVAMDNGAVRIFNTTRSNWTLFCQVNKVGEDVEVVNPIIHHEDVNEEDINMFSKSALHVFWEPGDDSIGFLSYRDTVLIFDVCTGKCTQVFKGSSEAAWSATGSYFLPFADFAFDTTFRRDT